MDYNYFKVLELSIDEIQDKDEATIKDLVNNAHTKLYALTIGTYANVPRLDGLTQAQWQKVLNDAKETLLDPRKRQKHIADLMPEPESTQTPEYTERPEPEPTQAPEYTERPEPEPTQTPEHKWRTWIALSIVQLLIAIFLWTWLHHAYSTGDTESIVLNLLITIGISIAFFSEAKGDRTNLFNLSPWEFALRGTTILALPLVFAIEVTGFRFYYVSLFLNPFFIILAFLIQVGIRSGFFKYCYYVTFDFIEDYLPFTSIIFLCFCVDYGRYWALIAIFAGTLAGGLVSYGIRTDFFSELFKLGFVSSVTSIDFVLFHFLIHCLGSLAVVVPFVRGVVYRRLGVMIKRLIMIAIVILVLHLTTIISDVFSLRVFNTYLVLLPAALIIIFYYTVGYIRHTRYSTK